MFMEVKKKGMAITLLRNYDFSYLGFRREDQEEEEVSHILKNWDSTVEKFTGDESQCIDRNGYRLRIEASFQMAEGVDEDEEGILALTGC